MKVCISCREKYFAGEGVSQILTKKCEICTVRDASFEVAGRAVRDGLKPFRVVHTGLRDIPIFKRAGANAGVVLSDDENSIRGINQPKVAEMNVFRTVMV